jgi:hypothetical protein
VTYTAPILLDGIPYPAALWQAALDEVARTSKIGAPILASKTVDEPLPSSTTLQDDDTLFASVAASTTYEVSLFLLFGALGAASTGGIKLGWSAPASSTFDWSPYGKIDSDATNAATSIWMSHNIISDTVNLGGGSANTVKMAARPYGYLTTSTTPGIFKFRWAQATSNGTATIVRAGSRLLLRPVG